MTVIKSIKEWPNRYLPDPISGEPAVSKDMLENFMPSSIRYFSDLSGMMPNILQVGNDCRDAAGRLVYAVSYYGMKVLWSNDPGVRIYYTPEQAI